MTVGMMTFNADGTLRLRLDRYYGKILGWVDIVLPTNGYESRFQSGQVVHDGLLLGTPFSFFYSESKATDGGDASYGFIPPVVTFSGSTMTWQYVRTSATDFAHSNFSNGRDFSGPNDGRLFYGVN